MHVGITPARADGGILSTGSAGAEAGVFRALFAVLVVVACAALACATLIHSFIRHPIEATPGGRVPAG